MKTLKLAFLVFALGSLCVLTSCNDETVLTQSKIPDEVQSYVSAHFPDVKILQVVKDRDGLKKSYDVILAGNTTLEFNGKLQIIGIDGNKELPASVIPQKISDYVLTNFPSNFITDWELEDRNQQISLDNDLDLVFNMDGDFIRIDD